MAVKPQNKQKTNFLIDTHNPFIFALTWVESPLATGTGPRCVSIVFSGLHTR